jgi:peroxiredoxin
MYSTALGADFSNTYPGGSKKLPIPATYIIDSNGIIIWRHFNPDSKDRATVEQIVKALKKPNKG